MEQGSILGSKYLNPDYLSHKELGFFQSFYQYVWSPEGIAFMKGILFFLSFFFLTIICYSVVRMIEIRAKEKRHQEHELAEYAHHKAEYEKHLREQVGGSKNPHWGETLKYLFSQHASDWKLAIIEADSMLEDLMQDLGFKGETLGDRLKSANQQTFPQLTAAWEVHTIRNRIAHEGLAFELSQHEAKRVINLYEGIFHSYGYI